jgi:hypothetical protein
VPDDQLRPEVVAALTQTAQFPADLVDQVLDASDAEREAAAGLLLEQTRALLEQAGVLRPSVGIMDLSCRTAAAICATFGTIDGIWSQPAYQHRPLGHVLKVVRASEAAWVVGVLRWGGLLPPDQP